jgi:hypothetical protein
MFNIQKVLLARAVTRRAHVWMLNILKFARACFDGEGTSFPFLLLLAAVNLPPDFHTGLLFSSEDTFLLIVLVENEYKGHVCLSYCLCLFF